MTNISDNSNGLSQIIIAANRLYPKTGIKLQKPIIIESDSIAAEIAVDSSRQQAILFASSGFVRGTTLGEKEWALARGYLKLPEKNDSYYPLSFNFKTHNGLANTTALFGGIAVFEQAVAAIRFLTESGYGASQGFALLFGGSAAYLYNKKVAFDKDVVFADDARATKLTMFPDAALSYLKKIGTHENELNELNKMNVESFSFKDKTLGAFLTEKILKPILKVEKPSAEARIINIQKLFHYPEQGLTKL